MHCVNQCKLNLWKVQNTWRDAKAQDKIKGTNNVST